MTDLQASIATTMDVPPEHVEVLMSVDSYVWFSTFEDSHWTAKLDKTGKRVLKSSVRRDN